LLKLPVIIHSSNYNYECFEIKVYIGEITYQYHFRKDSGTYRINDKPVERKTFIECYNDRKTPDKIMHQQQPVGIPQES
jgi:hypothetical protein